VLRVLGAWNNEPELEIIFSLFPSHVKYSWGINLRPKMYPVDQ
jgi:hypothetical protein